MTTVPNQIAKEIYQTSLRLIPLDTWRSLLPKDLVALCYHVVSDERLDHVRLYPYKNTTQFTNDVSFIRDRSVSYAQVAAHRLCNAPLDVNSILLTFDDGFVECYDVVRPILMRFGVDSVFFVTTEFVDNNVPFAACAVSLCVTAIEGMTFAQANLAAATARVNLDYPRWSADRRARSAGRLRWSESLANQSPAKRFLLNWVLGLDADDAAEIEQACALLGVDPGAYSKDRPVHLSSAQIRQLAADGFTIGAHGLNHRRLEGRSAADIEREIVASCTTVRQLTGQARVPFAFPYSGGSIDRNVLRDIVTRNGDLVDLLFDSGSLRRDPSFIVNRAFADEPSSGDETNLPRVLKNAWSKPTAWWLENRSSSSVRHRQSAR